MLIYSDLYVRYNEKNEKTLMQCSVVDFPHSIEHNNYCFNEINFKFTILTMVTENNVKLFEQT